MLELKPGVGLDGVWPQMVLAAHVVDGCYAYYGVSVCTITSANDGDHGKPGVVDPENTDHDDGKAFDVRMRTVPEGTRAALFALVKERLGDNFLVLWESRDHPTNVHLHVSYRPVPGRRAY